MRVKFEQMFKFRPNGADAFSDCLNYEKKQYEKQRRVNIINLSIIHLTPHFANTMLCDVFFKNFHKNMNHPYFLFYIKSYILSAAKFCRRLVP